MDQRSALSDPELARAWSLYQDCRMQQFVFAEIPKDGGKKVATKLLPFTTGYAHLPYDGGVLDQPIRLMAYFDQFRAGEARYFSESMNS